MQELNLDVCARPKGMLAPSPEPSKEMSNHTLEELYWQVSVIGTWRARSHLFVATGSTGQVSRAGSAQEKHDFAAAVCEKRAHEREGGNTNLDHPFHLSDCQSQRKHRPPIRGGRAI